jgi:hypothetical protein
MVSHELVPVLRCAHRLLGELAQVHPASTHRGVEHGTDRLRVVRGLAAHLDVE